MSINLIPNVFKMAHLIVKCVSELNKQQQFGRFDVELSK